MKTILTILSVIIINLPAFSINENIEQQFKNANKLYAENKFEDAAKEYESIISENYVSPELFYNTANAYYRLNNIGKAIYYYEKAKMYNPNNEDVNYNLELARLRVKDLLPDVPKIFPVRVFKQISFWRSYEFWSLFSLLFFVIFLTFVWLYFTSDNSRSKKLRLLISVIVLFFSISTFIFMQYNLSVLNAHNEAIVVNKESTAKSSPDNSANDLFRVYEGYKVKIESENGDWYEIMLPDGKKAWLKKEFLMVL